MLVPEPGELHEDDAAMRLAAAVAGPGLTVRGPAQSRVDLLAARRRASSTSGSPNSSASTGSIRSRSSPRSTARSSTRATSSPASRSRRTWSTRRPSTRARGWPASAATRSCGSRRSSRAGSGSSSRSRSAPPTRERFEASVQAKVEGLGSEIVAIDYVEDTVEAVEAALAAFTQPPDSVELILTAGAASTDPLDASYVAIAALGGRVVRRGVPAHPGSMLWLARIGRTAILGLPTCGAYSKATAADLLLPRLLSGEPASERTVAKLGHGGILTRSQRFRFPAYARELDAPDG